MKVSDIMTMGAHTVRPDSTIDAALDLLSTHHLTTLPVVDDRAVVGMVGEADIIRALVTRDPRAHEIPVREDAHPLPHLVRDVMSAPAFTVRPSDDVHDVAVALASHGWKGAPVVNAEGLVGVVSRSDVIRALSRSDEEIAQEVRSVLDELVWPPCQVLVRNGTVTVHLGAVGANESALSRAATAVPGVRAVHIEADAPTTSRGGRP
jgi:CBS domain-containing protein